MEALKDEIIATYSSQGYIKCIDLLNKAPKILSKTAEMRMLEASCLINIDGRSNEAHEILNEIIKNDPTNGLAYYGRGLAYLKEDKLVESVENFTKAAELDTTGMINTAQIMKLKAEQMLNNQRKSNRLSLKKKKQSDAATCDICNKSFAQQFSLNRHKLLHSGERPFKCQSCPQGFVQRSDLNRHNKVNHEDKKVTDVVKHKCETCGKEFKYKKLMKLHQITHSKRQKFNCDFCEKIFVTRPSLLAHIMSHVNRMRKAKNENSAKRLSDVFEPRVEINMDENLIDLNQSLHDEILESTQEAVKIIEKSLNMHGDLTNTQRELSEELKIDENNESSSKMETIIDDKASKSSKNTENQQEESSKTDKNLLNASENPMTIQKNVKINRESPKSAVNSAKIDEMLLNISKKSSDNPSTDDQLSITSNQPETTIKRRSNENIEENPSKRRKSSQESVSENPQIVTIKPEPIEIAESENSSNHDSLISTSCETDNSPEWNFFFKSLMHDLSKMDDKQKRKFKQKTFSLIDEIMD